jgi:tetratricopeptide (TPR) repeat protein
LLSHREGDDRAAQEYAQQALCIAQQEIDPVDPGYTLAVLGHALAALGHALAGLGEWDRAADAYRQFLDMLRELGKRDWAVLPLAGLAQVALAQGTCPEPVEGALEQAQVYAEQVLGHLEANPALYCSDEFNPLLRAIHEPLWIYLTCYRVLQASGDPRAREVLTNAHTMLQERAHKIDDEDLRRSYLENVPYHREIVALWEETSHP